MTPVEAVWSDDPRRLTKFEQVRRVLGAQRISPRSRLGQRTISREVTLNRVEHTDLNIALRFQSDPRGRWDHQTAWVVQM